MAEQLSLPLGHISSRQFEPVSAALEGAKRYTQGRYNPAGLEHTRATPARGFAVQQAFKDAQAAPQEAPGIRQSFEAMRQHVNRQYEFMTQPESEGGMGITHSTHDEEPYGFHGAGGSDKAAATEMSEDVRQNKHIKTLSAAATGGHEYFSDEENDRFRAVHDVFGHAATGRGFSRHGEEAAYLSHRQMFPKEAHAALTSETRGQNSYLNYGATLEHPEPSFPDQGPGSKLVGLPKFAQETGRLKAPRRTPGPSGQQTLF